MVVDFGILGGFGRQVQRKYIRKVDIPVGDFCKSLFNNQVGYLRSMGKVDIYIEYGIAEGRGRTKGRDMNYKDFMF